MALSFGRRGSGCSPLRGLAVAVGIAVCGLPGTAPAADISVILDEARLVKLPERVATLVIGNPSIADAAVQAGGMMVITGKGYGTTNILAIDRAGAVLLEKTIEVREPGTDVVVVYRGIERESYSCTPYCLRRVMLGDSPPFFDATATQTGARNALAQGLAQPK